jgi:hypothetical protein
LGIDAVSHVDGNRTIGADGLSLVSVVRVPTEPVPEMRVWTDWRSVASMSEIVSELCRTGEIPLPHVAIDPPVVRDNDEPTERPTLTKLDNGAILVSTSVPCLLERGVYQDQNWSALLESKSVGRTMVAPVLRSSLLKQAVQIPAGDWEVRFRYRPWWHWPSIFLCGGALVVLGYLLFLPAKAVGPIATASRRFLQRD